MNGKLDNYKTTEIHGKSQIELTLMVYDGALAEYRACRKAIEEGDTSLCRAHLEKAAKFVTCLYTTLDNEKGGEIAANLSKLYVHVLQLNDEIMATKDIAKLDDIITILNNLREGWKGLREMQVSQPETAAQADSVDKLAVFETA